MLEKMLSKGQREIQGVSHVGNMSTTAKSRALNDNGGGGRFCCQRECRDVRCKENTLCWTQDGTLQDGSAYYPVGRERT